MRVKLVLGAIGAICAIGVIGCGDSLRPIKGHDAQVADSTPDIVDGRLIDGGQDAAPDAPRDAGPDTPLTDAPTDAPLDAPPDAPPAACRDGLDNDGDGKADFPDDPGCDASSDDDELDDCPSGPNCPSCSNGVDDDGDGQVDYPADVSCSAASARDELCGERDEILAITSQFTLGTTVGAHDDETPSCGFAGEPDVQYTIDLPAMRALRIIDDSLVPIISVKGASCSGELACAVPNELFTDATYLTASNLPAGRSVIAVDGTGAFELRVDGHIAAGGSCEHPLFAAGVIDCERGSTCSGMVGLRTCVAECADGLDNNGDGNIDFPDDPGCSSPAGTEDTVCPGPLCPDCADGLDNDGDGLVDDDDPQCVSRGSWSERCNERDPVLALTQPVTLTSNFGSHDDFDGGCFFRNGPEVMFAIDLPDIDELDIGTNGDSNFNLVSLLDDSCQVGPTSPINCAEESDLFYFGQLAAGRYYFVFDTKDDDDLHYLDIRMFGTISAGGRCEGPLIDSGSFHCAAGMTCAGPPGLRTCQ